MSFLPTTWDPWILHVQAPSRLVGKESQQLHRAPNWHSWCPPRRRVTSCTCIKQATKTRVIRRVQGLKQMPIVGSSKARSPSRHLSLPMALAGRAKRVITPVLETGRSGLEASWVLDPLAKILLPYVAKGATVLNGWISCAKHALHTRRTACLRAGLGAVKS